jgi:hypothetical protein
LPNGLAIVRWWRHEPIKNITDLPRNELTRLTSKKRGSKFNESWGLERVVEFVAAKVPELAWRMYEDNAETIVMNETVGWANGKEVHAIRIVSDGRYVHAYPVEE